MRSKFKKIWKLALPYLKKGKRKNFVIHTQDVIKGMELLLEKEKGDKDILTPAAILHDVGWSRVPLDLQKSKKGAKAKKALELHLKHSIPIIKQILTKLGYPKDKIKKITEIVLAHKFKNPRRPDKQLLIDADDMVEVFKKSFYNDVKAYNTTPKKRFNFKKSNQFYTKTAKIIFDKELDKRRKEIWPN